MEFAGFSVELLAVLFVVAVLAGLIDTLAGGGGLIVVPALIVSGVPPLAALATNKLQGCMGTATSSLMMLRTKQVRWLHIKAVMLTAFVGAACGTIIVQFIDTDVLAFVIPIVLLTIALYFLFSPTPSEVRREARVSQSHYKNIVVPSIGFYDGMFGPGTGSFFALSGVACRGYGLVESTANAKPLNFATNMASLIIFIFAGHIVWVIGLLMMAGLALGAWLGSHCLLSINPKRLRVLVVLMCLAMLAHYANTMGWIM